MNKNKLNKRLAVVFVVFATIFQFGFSGMFASNFSNAQEADESGADASGEGAANDFIVSIGAAGDPASATFDVFAPAQGGGSNEIDLSESQNAPALSTDRADYAPGETVSIFGRFFQALQNIILKIFGGTKEEGTYTETTKNVIADEEGAFTTTYQLDNIFRPTYTIFANDAVSGEELAQTTFMDAVNIGYNKAVYRTDQGKWTTGNAGSAYQENQWAYYQYQITGITGGSAGVPSFNVVYNHHQPSSNAIFVDAFTNFRACLDDCGMPTGNKGLLPDGTPFPTTTDWKTFKPANINAKYVSGTCGGSDAVDTPSDEHCFQIDGSYLGGIVEIPADGTPHTITIFYEAHLAPTFVWNAGNEALLGCSSSINYVNPGSEVIPPDTAYGTDAYGPNDPCSKTDPGDWTASFPGIGSATGSSRNFKLQDQTAGPSGAITLPIPAVPLPTGSITITKVTNPTPASGVSFAYTGDLGSFSLDTDPSSTGISNTITFNNLPEGTYAVTEGAEPSGLGFTSLSCTTGGSVSDTTATITISSTITAVTCTYTNTLQTGHIIIVKDAVPNDQQDFTFTNNFGNGNPTTFDLDDDSDPTLPNTQNSEVLAGTYSVSETVPDEWTQTSATCSDGSPVSAIDVSPGETVTCTFVNTKYGHIIVDKVTNPSGDPQSFSFDAQGGTYADFALTDAAAPNDQGLVPGAYIVTENVPTGWNLTGLACDDSNGSVNLGTGTANISLEAGETVHCAYTNTKKPKLTVIKVTDPTNDTGKFNLSINSTQYATDVSNGGTTGAQYANIGANTFAEAAGTGTSLSDYTSAVSGDGCGGSATAGTITLAAGDNKTCTITNTRKAIIIVKKTMVGGTDTFSFTGTPSGPISVNEGTIQTSVVPGQYVSTETLLSGWDLTSVVCSDTNSVGSVVNHNATFNAEAGETITCTLTNTKRGSITVVKNTIGGNGTFNFASNFGVSSLTTSGETASQTVDNLVPGSGYNISETVPAGWDLTGAICDHGTISAIQVLAGQTTTCTFTNTKRGHIIVDKITYPSGDPQSFDFTTTGSGYTGFSLTDAAAPNNQEVVPGAYSVSENVPAGWDLDLATCDKGETPASLDVEPGETVTCTFENIKRGHIIIDKVTIPSGDLQLFDFDLTGGPDPISQKFQLADATTPYDSGVVKPGTYMAWETVPAGWDLTSATCSDGSPVTVISLQAGETITCTFTNTKRGHIIVVKDAVPNDAQDFTFHNNFANGNPDTFMLDDDSDATLPNTRNSEVLPGTYSVLEDAVAGWKSPRTTSCTDGSPVNAIVVSPGETVTCKFTNQKLAKIILVKNTIGGNDTFAFAMTGTGLPSSDTIATNNSTGSKTYDNLDPDLTYSIAETPIPAGWANTGASCTGTNTPASITPNSGEIITCTFTNNKPAAQIDLDPLTKTNKVGDDHIITATVQVHNGDGAWGPAADGTSVIFTLPVNNAGATFVGGIDTCTTISGTCHVTINATNTGNVQIHAVSSPVVLGVTLPVATGTGGENSADAQKTYVNARISITPSTYTNEIGNAHTFIVTVEQDTGSGFVPVPAGTLANAIAIPTPDGGLDVSDCNDGVNASGQCTVIINSSVAGIFTIAARSTVVVNGVEFKLQTDGSGSNSGPAIKTYVDANISLDPLRAINNINDPHNITATVMKDPGTGPIAAEGEQVTFSLLNNTAGATFVGGINTCATNASGQCSVQINTSTPGSVDIHAVSDVGVGGLALRRETDSTHGSSGDANKVYVAGKIIIEKQTLPDGSSQSFEFDPSYASNFFLTDGNQNDSGWLATGTYSVAELTPAGWDLTSAVCSDQSPVNAISLQADETVTCVFTNTQRGHIIIDKVTVGGDATFAFDATGGTDPAYADFNLSGADIPNDQELKPGTYSVSEGALTGWDLTSVICGGAVPGIPSAWSAPYTPGDPLVLDPGETITCTFTNTKRGEIIVQKVTVGGDGDFDFTADYSQGFTLSNGQSNNSGWLVPGTYSVSETVPTGWDLTSAICSDGSDPSSIGLTAGETVTCTFTNTKRGRIIVDKVTDPSGDPQSFGFDASGGSYADFSLTDTDTPNDQELVPGTYSVAENVPAGWDLTDTTCVSSNQDTETAGSISLQAGETVTCVFTNQKDAFIIVDKVTDPTGDPAEFDFTTDYGSPFVLADATAPNNSGDLDPGTYLVAEAAEAGWDLTSTSCTSSLGGSEVNTAIVLTAGETVTCTFTNTKRGHLIVQKTTYPAADPTEFSILATGTQPIPGGGAGIITDAADKDYEVKSGTYSVAETVPQSWQKTGDTCQNVAVGAGETKYCTFTNTKLGKITIVKDAQPNDCKDFNFFGTGGLGSFTLDDDEGITECIVDPIDWPQSKTFENLAVNTSYTVNETVPDFWNLISPIVCSGVAPSQITQVASGITVNLLPGDEVTCTFVNEKVMPTRTQGFWKTHTSFTTGILGTYFPTGMKIGDGLTHQDLIVSTAQLFGAWYSDVNFKSTATNGKTKKDDKRSPVDKARILLAHQLITAKLNCAAFGGCPMSISNMITAADAAYASKDISQMNYYMGLLDGFNNSGDTIIISPPLPWQGKATPKTSESIADKVFWDNP